MYFNLKSLQNEDTECLASKFQNDYDFFFLFYARLSAIVVFMFQNGSDYFLAMLRNLLPHLYWFSGWSLDFVRKLHHL